MRQWARLGPGPSNITAVIAEMPDKEERIVSGRLREFQAGIEANLAAIKERAEGRLTAPTRDSVTTESDSSGDAADRPRRRPACHVGPPVGVDRWPAHRLITASDQDVAPGHNPFEWRESRFLAGSVPPPPARPRVSEPPGIRILAGENRGSVNATRCKRALFIWCSASCFRNCSGYPERISAASPTEQWERCSPARVSRPTVVPAYRWPYSDGEPQPLATWPRRRTTSWTTSSSPRVARTTWCPARGGGRAAVAHLHATGTATGEPRRGAPCTGHGGGGSEAGAPPTRIRSQPRNP